MKVRFWIYGGYDHSRPEEILKAPQRTGAEVREVLLAAEEKGTSPAVVLPPRSDGPGSSQDLDQFKAALRLFPSSAADLGDPAWGWSRGSLRTPGAAIAGIPITFRLRPAEDANAIEYFTPDFEPKLRRTKGVVPADPQYFVNAMLWKFGLTGVRLEAEAMPEVARGTGLGGSNLVHVAAFALASMASGTDLTLPQIYGYASNQENDFGVRMGAEGDVRFGISLTGGQEGLTALQGGFWDSVHLPELGQYAVISRELVSKERYPELADHMLLVNAGKSKGHARKSTDVNNVWMSRFRDAEGTLLHFAKIEAAYDYVEGLRTGDWQRVVSATREYFDIRVTLCAEYASGIHEVLSQAKQHGAVAFPLGAGGFESTCLLVSEDPAAIASIRDHFRETEDTAIGRVAVPFLIDESGARFVNCIEWGLRLPEPPEEIEISS